MGRRPSVSLLAHPVAGKDAPTVCPEESVASVPNVKKRRRTKMPPGNKEREMSEPSVNKRLEFRDRGLFAPYKTKRFFTFMGDRTWGDLISMLVLMFLSKVTGKEVVYRKTLKGNDDD